MAVGYCGLQMSGLSAPCGFIVHCFHDFCDFAIVWGGLKKSSVYDGKRRIRMKGTVVWCKAYWSGEQPSSRVQSPVVRCKA